MTLCLLAGAVSVSLVASTATLAWTHSVERIAWEEVWQATPQGVVLREARVRGSGAGMEPPPEAVLRDGIWTWAPRVPPQERIVLRRSGATADWRICTGAGCRTMDTLVPPDADPVILTTCEAAR
ncbi:DUF1850 domain-containing protein [Salinarimonas soli]|uniref:DUF1850 domain-containing protein n=1 Tax=Salinarimonas soli TaxID=1638099 RepID=A0A5B2V8X5_9HYPH|nr:DUF1850 domain-containing protein [Salinarimonas soli]KAA2235025.1 DUF1850 domain-containing protein [Salinarimonas soli]